MIINGIDTAKKVCEMVAEATSRADIFDRFQIDYCCGGNESLEKICSDQGIDLETITFELRENDERKQRSEGVDLNNLSLLELIEHIEEVHHRFLKRELPCIEELLIKVLAHHSDCAINLNALQEVALAFIADMYQHMEKEEQILFPAIRQIASGNFNPCTSHCGSIQNPVTVMVKEHDAASEFLLTIRKLTNDYTPPDTACTAFRTLFQKLHNLELDMHRHVHKENHVLFPQAIKREMSQIQ